MKNNMQYLGFLGFLGLLGLFTDNVGFYGFFGAFGFFAYRKVIPDERFKENLGKAATNSFVASILVFALFATLGSLKAITDIYVIGFMLNFGLQMLIFSLSLTYYEMVGAR